MDTTTPYRLRRLSVFFTTGEAQTWTVNDEWRLQFSRRDVITLQKPAPDGTAADYVEIRKVAVAYWRLTTWMEEVKAVNPEAPPAEEARELDLL